MQPQNFSLDWQGFVLNSILRTINNTAISKLCIVSRTMNLNIDFNIYINHLHWHDFIYPMPLGWLNRNIAERRSSHWTSASWLLSVGSSPCWQWHSGNWVKFHHADIQVPELIYDILSQSSPCTTKWKIYLRIQSWRCLAPVDGLGWEYVYAMKTYFSYRYAAQFHFGEEILYFNLHVHKTIKLSNDGSCQCGLYFVGN